ncbi:MAG: alanine--tRNA ligase, partial [Microbacteriaceae bacterium]|nr:alanine--tRNA ligase [Microbacteriaceae bacterium]
FTGYDYLTTDSTILGLIVEGVSVSKAVVGDIAEVILAETSLYPESGGQEADAGGIVGNGFDLEVLDVQRPVKGLVSHRVQVRSGEVGVGDAATSVVDPSWRRGATQAHSATHLIHAALRQVLGPEAHQAGSYNKAGYMRLDFNWNQALSPSTRTEIEDIANNAIRENLEVETRIMPLADARSLGAMALFGEKYGETVRVVDIGGPWSRELCAGTHVLRSSEVGVINLVSETSVGSSNRRIESLVGIEAFRDLATERAIVSQLTSNLKTPRDQLPERISELVASLKAAEKRISEYEAAALSERIPALLGDAADLGGTTAVIKNVGALKSSDELRSLVTSVRGRLGSGPAIVALAADVAGKPAVIVATNDASRALGQKAGALAKLAAGILGGGGGGKDDLAQGGGSDLAAIARALAAISSAIAS